MSIFNTRTLGATGAEAVESQTEAMTMRGQNETVVVDAAAVVIATAGTGQLVVTDVTNGDSAVFDLHQEADVPIIVKSYGSTNINAAKDNASTLNVYDEAGVVYVQNKLAVDVSVNIKAYI